MPRTRWSRRRISVATASIVFVVSLWMVRGLGNWLIVSDPMAHADAVVALAGDVPFRSVEAARTYNEGWATEVWLTRPRLSNRSRAMADLGIEVMGSTDYDLQILEVMGVPPEAIKVLPDPVSTTADEVRGIERLLAERGGERVIIVTSPMHTRRTRTLWRRIVGDGAEALLRPARDAASSGGAWWRNSTDIEAVIHEVLGLVNAWFGSPIGP